MALNPRQERFCQLYATSGNASASYREAYEGALGAGQSAFVLLKNPKVKKRLEKLTGETAKKAETNRESLIAFWEEVRDTPVGDVDENHPLAQEFQHSDSGMKIKMPSKERAAMELARLTGAYEPEKHEVTADDELKKLLKKVTGG